MKQKRKFTKSLIRPIFNSLIGLIMLLSAAIGTVGYFEFADVLKEQYTEIAGGIAENVALEIDAGELDKYLETKNCRFCLRMTAYLMIPPPPKSLM